MAKGKLLTVVFKQNNQHQGMILPPDLSDLIAATHPVRTVNAVLDKIGIAPIVKLYKPGGTSSYHPRMFLKVLVYAYILISITFIAAAGLKKPFPRIFTSCG